MIMHADDTVLYSSHKAMKEIEKVLSQDLCTVSKWLQENELVLNLKKGKHRSDVVWHEETSKTTRGTQK